MTDLTTTNVDGWTLATGGFADAEPRMRDIDLAERLEYERPRDVRRLIISLWRTGKLSNIAQRDVEERADGQVASRSATEFWLTETQALKVVAKSATAKADALLDEVIRVFVAVRRGQIAPVDPIAVLSDPAALRGLLHDYAGRVLELQAANAELAPKAEVYDRIVDNTGTLGFREAAKVVHAATGVSEPEFRIFLLSRGWVQRLGGRLAPAHYGQAQGYVTTREREVATQDGLSLVVPELRITQRGIARVTAALLKESA
jgi:phage antirepressor YoqD-like protein